MLLEKARSGGLPVFRHFSCAQFAWQAKLINLTNLISGGGANFLLKLASNGELYGFFREEIMRVDSDC